MWNKLKICSMVSGKKASAGVLLGSLMFLSQGAQALTADDVLNKMSAVEQASFMAGAIGGLAYSRFLREKPEKTGMDCIYDWYYESEDNKWSKIETWFSRHPDKPAIPMLYILVKKECGE